MILRLAVTAALCLAGTTFASAQDTSMSFFITSTNPGKGADLGGLSGADVHCSSLAEAAGVTGKTCAPICQQALRMRATELVRVPGTMPKVSW